MDIPLFPLHTVLCPGIVVPLHVFEERYRALTRHCLETGAPFGIVLIRDGREVGSSSRTLARVGALVEIREAGRYPDGRYDLLAAATGRFAIDSVDVASAPYMVAAVTQLEDEVGDEARAERLAASAIRRFVRYLELMRIRDGETGEALDIRVELDTAAMSDDAGAEAVADSDDEPEEGEADVEDVEATTTSLTIPDDPTVLSYLLSGIVQVELPRRQRLLEAGTTVERLEELITLLDREVLLLARRLRLFSPDSRVGDVRRS
jgi:Lon protease-like protein